VNLQFTGRMVANMQIIDQQKASPNQNVTIGFPNKTEENKAETNTERSGTWLGLRPNEEKAVAKVGQKLIEKKIGQIAARKIKIKIT